MTSPLELRGLWVPIITPFTADDQVDHDALARLAASLLDDGADGLVALGTTGEPATLDPAEQRAVVATCAEACARRDRPLIVGCGSNDTRATVDAVRAWSAHAPTAVAFLVVVPYYTRPSQDAVVRHFEVVAAESPRPLVVYNVPYRTGRGLDGRALATLGAVANIAGVKQAVGAVDHDTMALLATRPDGFAVLAGDDAYIAPLVLSGASGAIAAAAHVRTAAFARLIAAASDGRVHEARSLAATLLPVVDAGFAEPNPAVWKAALHALGAIATPALRMPMTAASRAATEALLAAVSAADAGS